MNMKTVRRPVHVEMHMMFEIEVPLKTCKFAINL